MRPARQLIVAGLGIFLGFAFWWVDLREATAIQKATDRSAQLIRQRDPGAKIWFLGHLGFQHYAELAGMTPIVPEWSQLRRGDWVVTKSPSTMEHPYCEFSKCVLTATDYFEDDPGPIPLRTTGGYYLGYAPLVRASGPWAAMRIYRVDGDGVPRTKRSPYAILAWANVLNRPVPPRGLAAIARRSGGRGRGVGEGPRDLRQSPPDALAVILENPDPAVRRLAKEMLHGRDVSAAAPTGEAAGGR